MASDVCRQGKIRKTFHSLGWQVPASRLWPVKVLWTLQKTGFVCYSCCAVRDDALPGQDNRADAYDQDACKSVSPLLSCVLRRFHFSLMPVLSSQLLCLKHPTAPSNSRRDLCQGSWQLLAIAPSMVAPGPRPGIRKQVTFKVFCQFLPNVGQSCGVLLSVAVQNHGYLYPLEMMHHTRE